MSQFHPLKVTSVSSNTASAVTIAFEIPDHLKKEFDFVPGQYITIQKELNGEKIRRAYSICSASNSNTLEVGIKKVENGTFSVDANNNIKAGDLLEVMAPEGKFTFEADSSLSRNIAAFAAGSGITPIMSIMKSVLHNEPQSNFILVYGNKSFEDAMFKNELEALREKFEDRLFIYYANSRSKDEDALFGRIDKAKVNFITKNKHKNTSFDAFYLCGPEAMIELVSETLVANGIAKERIKFELFTSSDDTNDTPSLPEGEAKVNVTLDDEVFTFSADTSKRILDAVLEKEIDAPYSCQGGICSSCIARVKDGKAEMVKNQILTDAEVAEGLILTCQSHIISDEITIDFDDV